MTIERHPERHSCGMQRRLWRHYVPLLGLSGAAVAALYAALDQGAVQRLSIGTGYAALALLAFTLSVGPVRALRGRRLPASIDLRRDAGISTAIVGLAHVVIALQVHHGGAIQRYFSTLDKGGPSNWIGLAATLLLVLLLAISSNRAMRRLRTRRWKRLQRLAYALFALVAVHTILYQLVERRAAALAATGAVVMGATVALQLAGARRRVRRPPPQPTRG
jgi:methionine sulfoxide reductase heme-binding subunit